MALDLWNIDRLKYKVPYKKLMSRLFFIFIMLVVLQTSSVFGLMAGVNIVAHGILALAGGGREKKQEKIIARSETEEKISGMNITVLRVKEADIKSKAKTHIIALQNRLDRYHTQYKNNEPLTIPKNDSDVIAIQDIDTNWPTEDYISELRAYKKYAVQQHQKMPPLNADSLHLTPATTIKKAAPAQNFK